MARFFELAEYIICANAISPQAEIGEGTVFYHHGIGCVVHKDAKIGCNCNILQHVTIGNKFKDGLNVGDPPQIGNNVTIGAGAVIIGKIIIGNDVIIGANAVVVKDVPDRSIALGVPAQIKKR